MTRNDTNHISFASEKWRQRLELEPVAKGINNFMSYLQPRFNFDVVKDGSLTWREISIESTRMPMGSHRQRISDNLASVAGNARNTCGSQRKAIRCRIERIWSGTNLEYFVRCTDALCADSSDLGVPFLSCFGISVLTGWVHLFEGRNNHVSGSVMMNA